MAEENKENLKKGGISVETEHIFPVIKKWLYSDKEIFLREIVSNSCDAVTKLKRLSSLGNAEIPEDENFYVKVSIDKEAKILTVSDNGIGMTEDEVQKYICNIALSGALDFIEKYESGKEGNSIIGHFGLGFYSAFMVSDSVEIVTRSYTGAPCVHWVCSESGEYSFLEDGEERERGTDVILHLNDDGKEYLDKYTLSTVLDKYCSFMPVDIFLSESGEEAKEPVNDKNPLWMKNPADCTEEEYNEFFKKLFSDMREPLFHVHINADYPLNFKGIIYFPPIRNDYDTLEGKVKLYYNQVFVADNLKEVIPEYLLLLRGVLDCPELPLNVSRSYLQNSGYVSKISAHITKKVADKIVSLFTNEREKYEKFWDDIRFFVEYGAIKDKKFYERVKDALLLKLSDGSYVPLTEFAKDENNKKLYYASDKVVQAQYISMFENKGIKVAMLSGMLDMQFMNYIESELKVKFTRVDSETSALSSESEEYENDELASLFGKVSGNEKLMVKFESLSDASIPALINISEEDRRFSDMMKMYDPDAKVFEEKMVLVLNSANPVIRKLGEKVNENKDDEKALLAASQIWSLALIAQRPLSAEELKSFLSGAYSTVENLVNE